MSVSAPANVKVAVIGAGPAGIYAADILLKTAAERDIKVTVDILERLPAPYGLVRYGVAPDHPRIKGVISALRDVLDRGDIRLFGNIEVGKDVSVDDLRARYNAIIVATGAVQDAPLGIPGIDLPGSFGAAEFVNWFDGHPDVPREWVLDAASVGVIGNGNVALDVARMLAKHVTDLMPTEIPDNVASGLADSKITDVHVFGRRGPHQTKFTPLELRELGEVPDVDIVLDPKDFEPNEWDEAELAATNQRKVIARIFNSWLARPAGNASRRIHLHFYSQPVAVMGDTQVTGLRLAHTERDEDGAFVATGETYDIALGQIYRAVGYYGSPLEDLPFAGGVIANAGGRVASAGIYTTGWIKRGPVGLIGSTKSDARETVANLLEDVSAGKLLQPTAGDITELIASRGIEVTDLDGWHKLDAFERALGRSASPERERIKVVSREGMLKASRDAESK